MSKETTAPDVEVLLEVKRTDATVVRVQKLTYGDDQYIDIRNFYKKKTDKDFSPGKGMSLPYDSKLWSKICKAIKKEFTSGE